LRIAATAALLIGSLAVAGLVACGGSTPAPHLPPSATRSAPSAAAASGDPRAHARAAYLGMWAAFVRASRTADYQSSSLAHYAAGSALSVLVHGLYKNFKNGIVTRGQPTFNPKVKVATKTDQPFQATITDCADSSHWADYLKSGKPAPGAPRGRQRIVARLQPFDGVWKVTYLVVEKEGTC
jgi:hypothetical protein